MIDLPWEYLYDSSLERFFSHSTNTPIIRYLDLGQAIRPLAVTPPLNVLVMIASPRDFEALDVEAEWQKIESAVAGLRARGLIQLTRLPAATLSALQKQLRQEQYHIFHYIGHGGFDQQTQDGVLLLEDESGRSRLVNGNHLGTLLHDHPSLRLAVLNACEGARTTRSDPFAGVAQQLVRQGIPAVIAMQFEITDRAAIILAQEFYDALADGYPVDAALAEARKSIYTAGNDIEWGTPVLYLRAADGQLFDLRKWQAKPSAPEPVVRQIPTPVEVEETVEPSATITAEAAAPLRQATVPVNESETAQRPVEQPKAKQPRRKRLHPAWFWLGGIGLILLTWFGFVSYTELQQRGQATATAQVFSTAVARSEANAAATATAVVPVMQATATAIAVSEIGRTMLQNAPQLRPLAERFGMLFVYVPAGEFLMGSSETQIDQAVVLCKQFYGDGADCLRDRYTDEAPQHTVRLDEYWIMQTEVTNAQFGAFIAAGGYTNRDYWSADGWQWRTNNHISRPGYWDEGDLSALNQPVVGVSWYESGGLCALVESREWFEFAAAD